MWTTADMPSGRVLVLSESTLQERVDEIAKGLGSPGQPTLPAWFLYDDAGSALFDRICTTPEYYPTRTELALLSAVAPDIARKTRARELLELGSGLARKTGVLLDALGAGARPVAYLPFDVSAVVVEESVARLSRSYRQLSVLGLVGDFTRDLPKVPRGNRRLVAFLGGTIGNFDVDEAGGFLGRVAGLLGQDDWLLVAADLVKDRDVIHRAYNDAQGVTAAFNLNTLTRLRGELSVEVEPDDFEHEARFDEVHSRIEMHARARRPTRLRGGLPGISRLLAGGESIRTEISRKFTRPALAALHEQAGLQVEAWYVADVPYALVLSRRVLH